MLGLRKLFFSYWQRPGVKKGWAFCGGTGAVSKSGAWLWEGCVNKGPGTVADLEKGRGLGGAGAVRVDRKIELSTQAFGARVPFEYDFGKELGFIVSTSVVLGRRTFEKVWSWGLTILRD